MAEIEGLAQPPDMYVHGAFVDVDVAAPHPIEKLLAGEYASGTFQQEFEQPVLGRSEIDRTAAARDALLLAVHRDVAEREDVGYSLRAGAAQQGAYPGHELGNRERFDHVIVGPSGKPA